MPLTRRALLVVENLSVPADRRVWMEAQALRDAGWDVTVLCPQGESRDTEASVVLEGIIIDRFPLAPAEDGVAGYLREYAQAVWRIVRATLRLSRAGRFDVVHVCNPPDIVVPALAFMKLRGSRLVFDHHDLVPELFETRYGNRGPLYRAALVLERLTFALADVTLATNESYARVARERGRKRAADVFVVRNAPNLDRFRPGEPNPTLRGGRRHLLAYVGVMGPQDGVDAALRALALLKERRSDWRAIFGGDGASLPSLRALAAELGLTDDVEFLGWCDDTQIVELLSTASVALAPETRNPLNDLSTMIKVAEYMAMERPVVAFDLPESVVTAGEAGAFARSGDIEAFTDRIDELLDDDERRAAMGRTGRARVEGELSWERSAAALRSAYERALSR